MENYDKVWLSSRSMMACLHGPRWWKILRTVYCNKWSPARLCTGTNTVQYAMLTDAFQCPNQKLLWWQDVQPKKVASRIKGEDRSARWAFLCWWHAKECLNTDENGKKTSIECHKPVTTMILKFSTKRQPAPGNHPLLSQPSQWIDKDCKLLINAPILKGQEQWKFVMR